MVSLNTTISDVLLRLRVIEQSNWQIWTYDRMSAELGPINGYLNSLCPAERETLEYETALNLYFRFSEQSQCGM